MTRLQRLAAVWGAIALGAVVSGAAARDRFGYGPEPSGFDPTAAKQWQESAVSPPPAPREDDLLDIPLPPSVALRVRIDRVSLTRADDRVLRYTAVVASATGTRNVLFEGIRCETREYKTYAIGGADGGLKPLADPGWQRLVGYGPGAFRQHLYEYYLCDHASSARAPEQIVQLIQYPPADWSEFIRRPGN